MPDLSAAKAKLLYLGDIFTTKLKGDGDPSVQVAVVSSDVKGGDEDISNHFQGSRPSSQSAPWGV
jgi:hypothetical protein